MEWSWCWISVAWLELRCVWVFGLFEAVFGLLLCGVSYWVFVYACWYGLGDGKGARLVGTLVWFTLGMLVLVSAGDVVTLFVGWECIGICSYLLISYYGSRSESALSGLKALVFNRVGDVTLLWSLSVALFVMGGNELECLRVEAPCECFDLVACGVCGGLWCKSAQFG